MLTATVFSPDDLDLVKGEPARRRRWIDNALTAVRPSLGALRNEVDRILRHRNTLLRQAGGRAVGDVAITLDVWDAKLAASGDELRSCRRELLEALQHRIHSYYAQISKGRGAADASYTSSWGDVSLAGALAAARRNDLETGDQHRRAPPRRRPAADRRAARAEPRIPGRAAVAGTGSAAGGGCRSSRTAGVCSRCCCSTTFFSELDSERAAALLEALPQGQRILTTAAGLPAGVRADRLIRLAEGTASTVSGPGGVLMMGSNGEPVQLADALGAPPRLA